VKVNTNLFQEENSELQSQLEVLQKQLENSEVEKRKYISKYRELKDRKRHDAAIQTDAVCSKKLVRSWLSC